MTVLETERLRLRWFTADDAAFVYELVNDPAWVQYIGDRGVRTLDDARAYIQNRLAPPYHRDGFGFYLTETKADGVPIGLCGMIKREGLDNVDIGFAFLPAFRGQGYAYEAAAAVLLHAQQDFHLIHLAAITSLENPASIRLLKKLGFRYERLMHLPGEDEAVRLFIFHAPHLNP